MKLNIEELAHENRLFGVMKFDDLLGKHVLTEQAKAFARLIVERCASIAEDYPKYGEATAAEIRNLLEDK